MPTLASGWRIGLIAQWAHGLQLSIIWGALGAVTPPQVQAHFAAELGKGVAIGLHALGPFKTLALHQGGLADADGKQGYGEEDIVVLMSFLHVKKGSQLQDIWTYFQSLQAKTSMSARGNS